MSFDRLPTELLHVIAADSEPAYKALILAYPRFARLITPGKRVDYMVYFGHDVRVSNYGIRWTRNGLDHRLNGPSTIYNDGSNMWHHNGKFHRDDGPAVIDTIGTMLFYQNGTLHREDGPAVIYKSGDQFWCQHGELHRDGGAAIICSSGRQIWYQNGVLTEPMEYSQSITKSTIH